MTVKVVCQSEVYDQQAALRLAAISFTRESSAALGSNYALVGQATTTLTAVTVTNTKRGTLALSTLAEGVWVYRWSLAHLEARARQIAGARKQDALARLQSLEGVQTANILLSGREQTTLPVDPSRISIIVAGAQTKVAEIAQPAWRRPLVLSSRRDNTLVRVGGGSSAFNI